MGRNLPAALMQMKSCCTMLTYALELRLSCSVSACKLLWTFACSGTQFGEQWQDGNDVGLHASTSQERPLYAFIKRLLPVWAL